MRKVVRPRELLDGLANQGLVLNVHGAGGFVEDEDRGIAEHGPRQGDSLPLAAGKAAPALADQGVILLRQRHDELMGISSLCRLDDPVAAGVGSPYAMFRRDGVLKEDRVLGDDADLRREICGPAGREHLARRS